VIASLLWKEYREHRSVWIAMALLAVISLTAAAQLLLPQGWRAASQDAAAGLVGGAIILTAMYGLVCGGMMFAGERESRGMAFLSILPLGRAELWWFKCLIGLVFVLLYCGVILGIGAAIGVVGPNAIPPHWTLLLPIVALEAYAWGLCTSTFCRTVLTAVALAALVPLPVLGLFSGMCLAAGNMDTLPFAIGLHLVAGLVALGISLAAFVDRDFEKRFILKPTSTSYGTIAPRRQPRRYEVLFWLVLRQGGIVIGVLCVLGFLLGLTLPTAGTGVWPVVSLFLGVACGTAVFAGEQGEGAYKFWGDQRLPVGWLWLRRSAVWTGVIGVVTILMLLAALLHAAADRDGLPREPGLLLDRLLGLPAGGFGPMGSFVFLLMWPAYGFAFGQLCSLIWRKGAVAVVVAMLAGAGAASVWVPSLLGGGLNPVQVLGVPLLLLGACRLALWDWVTDRLKTRPAMLRLVGGVLLSVVWVAANCAYRGVEVPGGGEPFDRAAMQARLSNPEEGRAGQKIREEVHVADEREHAAAAVQDRPFGAGPGFQRVPDRSKRGQLARVIEHGWAAADPEFENWLAVVTAKPWPSRLAEAVKAEPGVLIDPRETSAGQSDSEKCRKTGELLTARALQIQAQGKDDKSLEQLVTVLALSRHLRHQAPLYAYQEGLATERSALKGLEHWLERVGPRADLLRRALDELTAHEANTPPVTEALAAEYFRFRRSLGSGARSSGLVSGETEAMLMQIPWEAARAGRLTDAVFAGRLRMAEAGDVVPAWGSDQLADWLPERDGSSGARLERLVNSSWLAHSLPVTVTVQREAQRGLCDVRAARLQVALALYRCEHGKIAESLDDLVAAVLPELPDDPYQRRAFGYRVSQGERISWHRRLIDGGEQFTQQVPAGQGILWSAGPDGRDDGGLRQWDGLANTPKGCDVIYLVPAGR
jgi:ABC-type transport system involved in multi-copper enzyme maturation permease subunit